MQYAEEDDIELVSNSAPLLASRSEVGNDSAYPAVRARTTPLSYPVNRRLLRARNLLFLSVGLNLLVLYWAL
jgi:hypothetical protein